MPSNQAMAARPFPGFTVFFTGLAAAGKSTAAEALRTRLVERTSRPVTLLDGDVLRKTLWPDLGFSKADRDLNIRRIGRMAAEITEQGGIAICATIAPYARMRDEVRASVAPFGGFVLVYVATPLAVCERRDPKGLYAQARLGLLEKFTGVSDPYEPPEQAEVVIDTTALTPEAAAGRIVEYLEAQGYLEAGDKPPPYGTRG
jgi:sulfate adenylyltransferase